MIFAISLLSTACTAPPDQSIFFNDDYLKRQVTEALHDQNISYVEDGDTIWFSTRDGDAMDKVFQTAVNRRPVHYAFSRRQDQEHFVVRLEKEGIKPVVIGRENGDYVVGVSKEARAEAERAFRATLSAVGKPGSE